MSLKLVICFERDSRREGKSQWNESCHGAESYLRNEVSGMLVATLDGDAVQALEGN